MVTAGRGWSPPLQCRAPVRLVAREEGFEYPVGGRNHVPRRLRVAETTFRCHTKMLTIKTLGPTPQRRQSRRLFAVACRPVWRHRWDPSGAGSRARCPMPALPREHWGHAPGRRSCQGVLVLSTGCTNSSPPVRIALYECRLSARRGNCSLCHQRAFALRSAGSSAIYGTTPP